MLCPGASIPETIQTVLKRLFEFAAPPSASRLPCTYPPSTITEATSYATASQTSWYSASDTSWVTAIQYSVSSELDQSSTIADFISEQASEPGITYKPLIGASSLVYATVRAKRVSHYYTVISYVVTTVRELLVFTPLNSFVLHAETKLGNTC